jgi:phage terminase large subunit
VINVNANTGKVGKRIVTSLRDGYKEIINKGGTGSGKTYDHMLVILWLMMSQVKNKVATVVSESKPHLDIGALRYAKTFTTELKEQGIIKYNDSKSFFTFPNGNILEFFSADRIDKALGARRWLLFANEVNSLKYDVFSELARRSEITLADFNPTAQFWLEDKFIPYCQNPIILKSNYLDNIYLPEHEKIKIEKRAALDRNFKRIHIDCEYGVAEGLVFENWNMIDAMPESYEMERFGLDFGYTNDPTSLIHMRQQGDSLFFDELIYQTGLLNTDIIALMNAKGLRKNFDVIHADSAEPKSIEEIFRAGYNCKPATIAKKSINNRIDKLKTYNIYVTKRSTNLIKELRTYFWISDKQGNPTNKPIDNFNHAIDAMGYSINDLIDVKDEIFVI